MRVFMPRLPNRAMTLLLTFFASLVLAGSTLGQTQATAADLRGTVTDQTGAVVSGASVTARDVATGISRTVVAGADGDYQFLGLQPGEYEISAEAATFKKVVISGIKLTVGQDAALTIKLEVGAASAVVTVSGSDVQLVETTKSTVSNTIDQQRIQNLPINERSATGFALTLSTVGRDNGRPIGPAPTSGLNIGGQRGRSTQVNVDGADFTDNSINASRTTVSMEAVQEYQVATNSYTAEFGRATGGIVNVVTKRGTNDVRGNVFGFIRDRRIQARNAFAPIANPAFRRTQWGATIGGPIKKERAFFFAAFERRKRDESGFFTSNVAQGLNGSLTATIPGLPQQTFTNLSPAQAATAAALLGNAATATLGVNYLYLTSGGGSTALTGSNPLISPGGAITAGTVVGPRFFLTGTPVPSGTTNSAGQPIAFRPLNNLQKVFPVTDRANYFTTRIDHSINTNNQLSLRVGYNTGNLTGIQVESQNQSLGQNDFSRTGITTLKDTSFSAALNSALSGSTANEFRYAFGNRNTTFKSQNPDAVAFNISGAAFIGRELFSPVARTERRHQFADNYTWIIGDHTTKFGGDISWVSIPTAHFELNFAGLFNFGQLSAASAICGSLTGAAQVACAGALATAPDLTPVQTYGLGLPSTFIQGFGNPDSTIKNKPIAFFGQDSWKVSKNLTINYGLRYDVELTETIAPVGIKDPLSGITLAASDILAAQDAIGVQQGIPRDKNNWAPRFGFAWDVTGKGESVIRGSYGLYYDHPLLAVAFNSDIADTSQQQQSILTASGGPSPTSLLNATQVFQGTVCGVNGSSSAICGPVVTPGIAPSAQYLFGRQRFNDQTFTGFGSVLPFSLPIAKSFEYASATQGNIAYEQRLTKDMSLSAAFIFVGAHHLPHPTDLNPQNTSFLIQNYVRCFGTQPTSTTATLLVSPSACSNILASPIPGMISVTTRGGVIAPAVANFFRPNAPNYFLASALSGGAVSPAVLNGALGASGTLRTPGVISPFGSVNAQISDGNSNYKAFNLELKRRFANNFAFLASYTRSHSIDDSSDLQTLLLPQDVTNFRAERSDSLFDQRHRFVFSGVLNSPVSWRNGDGWHRFLSDFTLAPIIEISSGRPFNIITNVDANTDQSSQTDRPSANADGTLCVPGSTGCITPLIGADGRFSSGNLGRNRGKTHSYSSVDLRLSRAFNFGERFRIDLIAEGFNLFNRFNEASASPFFVDVNTFNQRASGGSYYSRPTAAYDSRQFQFGAKFSF